MAIQPLSGNSQVVVYNADVNLDDKSTSKQTQGVTVTELLAAGGKTYKAEVDMATGSAIVYQNTLGAEITWASISTGNVGTNINATLFGTDSSVFVQTTDMAAISEGAIPAVVSAKRIKTLGIVEVSRIDQFSGAANGTFFIEIQVF
tara:strand:+ start:82 stop:522 length:441 start_codon:yes stop_codon:yes gene_type:complete